MEVTLVIALLVLLLANIWATILVSRSVFLVKARKKWQMIFVWVIPMIGAAFVIYFHTEPKETKERSRAHFDPGSEID